MRLIALWVSLRSTHPTKLGYLWKAERKAKAEASRAWPAPTGCFAFGPSIIALAIPASTPKARLPTTIRVGAGHGGGAEVQVDEQVATVCPGAPAHRDAGHVRLVQFELAGEGWVGGAQFHQAKQALHHRGLQGFLGFIQRVVVAVDFPRFAGFVHQFGVVLAGQ